MTITSECAVCRGRIFWRRGAGTNKQWLHADVADWRDDPHNAVPTVVQQIERGVVLAEYEVAT